MSGLIRGELGVDEPDRMVDQRVDGPPHLLLVDPEVARGLSQEEDHPELVEALEEVMDVGVDVERESGAAVGRRGDDGGHSLGDVAHPANHQLAQDHRVVGEPPPHVVDGDGCFLGETLERESGEPASRDQPEGGVEQRIDVQGAVQRARHRWSLAAGQPDQIPKHSIASPCSPVFPDARRSR
jgi:hypothetical protein